MARHVSSAKSDPADIAKIAIDGIAAGDAEIIADEISRQVLAGLVRRRWPLPPARLTHRPCRAVGRAATVGCCTSRAGSGYHENGIRYHFAQG